MDVSEVLGKFEIVAPKSERSKLERYAEASENFLKLLEEAHKIGIKTIRVHSSAPYDVRDAILIYSVNESPLISLRREAHLSGDYMHTQLDYTHPLGLREVHYYPAINVLALPDLVHYGSKGDPLDDKDYEAILKILGPSDDFDLLLNRDIVREILEETIGPRVRVEAIRVSYISDEDLEVLTRKTSEISAKLNKVYSDRLRDFIEKIRDKLDSISRTAYEEAFKALPSGVSLRRFAEELHFHFDTPLVPQFLWEEGRTVPIRWTGKPILGLIFDMHEDDWRAIVEDDVSRETLHPHVDTGSFRVCTGDRGYLPHQVGELIESLKVIYPPSVYSTRPIIESVERVGDEDKEVVFRVD